MPLPCVVLWIAPLLVAGTGLVAAQGVAQPGAARDTKEAREAEDVAAMERARRLAANPMRLILEASRARRKPDAEPSAQLVSVAATGPVGVTGSAGAAEPPGRVQATAVPEPPAVVINSELVQPRAASESQPAIDTTAVPRPVAATSLTLPALTPLMPELIKPTLVQRVDPELPQRVLAEVAPNTVVVADLTILPDGSVTQVQIVTPNTRALGRAVQSALQQWRFAPLPNERPWRVELLFRPE